MLHRQEEVQLHAVQNLKEENSKQSKPNGQIAR